jgi:predicted DNA-binding transcriptional regulator YafY
MNAESRIAARAPLNLRSRNAGVTVTGFWRLYEIHKLISEGAYPNCPRIAQMIEVTNRTVERDIGRLRDLFCAPIEFDRARGGYYYTEPFEMPAVRLGDGEAIALFLGQRLLSQCRGTPFEDFVQQAMTKIRVLLPQSVVVDVQRTLGTVSFKAESLRGEELEVAERYQLLVRAAVERKSVAMEYYTVSSGRVSQRLIDPYHLRLADGTWYCIAYCHERTSIRTFALDRIIRLEVTDDTFEIPAGFSVEEYLADSLSIERGTPRRVVIEFDPTQAAYIRGRQWHKSQELTELPGGRLRMTVTIGGLGELKRWVMSMGSHAQVLEPRELRDQIRRELESAADKYR